MRAAKNTCKSLSICTIYLSDHSLSFFFHTYTKGVLTVDIVKLRIATILEHWLCLRRSAVVFSALDFKFKRCSRPGPGCKSNLRLSGIFQFFSVFRRIFFRVIMDNSTEDALMSIRNTKGAQRNHLERRKWLQKSQLIFRCFM